eukprot:m.61251 g.61251  ORF g.61251 m.61251 type:complete len:282 (-) comp13328_c0_seq1:206-1051(-)
MNGSEAAALGSINGQDGLQYGILASMLKQLHDEIAETFPADIGTSLKELCVSCLQQSLELELELATERRKTWEAEKQIGALTDHLEATVKRALLQKKRVTYLEEHSADLKKRATKLQAQLDAAAVAKRKAVKAKMHVTQTLPLSQASSAETISLDPIQARTDVNDARRLRQICLKLEKQLVQKDQEVATLQAQVISLKDQLEGKDRMRKQIKDLEQQLQSLTQTQLALKQRQQRERRNQLWKKLEHALATSTSTSRSPTSRSRSPHVSTLSSTGFPRLTTP